jgi:hypothetical protein
MELIMIICDKFKNNCLKKKEYAYAHEDYYTSPFEQILDSFLSYPVTDLTGSEVNQDIITELDNLWNKYTKVEQYQFLLELPNYFFYEHKFKNRIDPKKTMFESFFVDNLEGIDTEISNIEKFLVSYYSYNLIVNMILQDKVKGHIIFFKLLFVSKDELIDYNNLFSLDNILNERKNKTKLEITLKEQNLEAAILKLSYFNFLFLNNKFLGNGYEYISEITDQDGEYYDELDIENIKYFFSKKGKKIPSKDLLHDIESFNPIKNNTNELIESTYADRKEESVFSKIARNQNDKAQKEIQLLKERGII